MESSDKHAEEINQFHLKYLKEELLDLEYVKSIGGWPFVKAVTPLFLKGSRDALSRIIFCAEENDIDGVKFGLHKLMMTANVISALKIVRSILALQLMIDKNEPDLSPEIEQLVDHFNEMEEFLNSLELFRELEAGQAS